MKNFLQSIIVCILSFLSVSTIQSQNVVTIGSATTSTYYSPINMYYKYSWNRLLYLNTEIGNTTNSAKITKIAFQYDNASPSAITNQTCYFQATSATTLSSGYIDPLLSGATQVWSGTLNCSQGWVEITLSTPFILPAGSNLMIHWHNNQNGFKGSSYTWNYTASPNKVVQAYNDNGFPSGSSGTIGNFRPNIRLTWTLSTRTVAVHSITQPADDFVNYGINLPASVKLKNPGKDTITSCRINWSVNDVLQTPVYNYIPLIESDTAIPVQIGTYTPIPNMVNRIKVWVDNAMPYDSIRNDDTLLKDFYVCTNGLLGVYTIGGASDSFATISDAMEAVLNCGISGNVTFLLRSGTYMESLNFTDTIQGMTSADKVTFASAAGNADSVIFISLTDPTLLLSNTMNLIFSHITFDASNGPNYGVKFEENVSGVEIRHCNIKSNTTTTINTYAAVYYGNSASTGKSLYDIKLIANTFDGGYYNVYFTYAGTTSNTSKITIDSNIFMNSYYYGLYAMYYGYFPSISHNVFTSRFTDNGNSWYGMYLYYYNSADTIVGNKIYSINKSISTAYGMTLGYYINNNNYGTYGDLIVANNEIMLYTSSTSPGIYASYPFSNKLKLLHNSVYMYGSGNAYGMYVYNYNASDNITIMGNNLITDAGSLSYPAYLGYYCTSPYLTVDYNNYYSSGSNIAYANGAKTTLAALQTATGQDVNSMNVLPVFKNLSANLHTNGQSMLINRNPAVLYDLEGTLRLQLTNIGCYQDFYNGYNNASPTTILSPLDGVSSGTLTNVSITLKNFGQNRLDSVRIHWKINAGVENVYYWTGSLLSNTTTNVNLGTMIPVGGVNNILIYTTHPNGKSDDDVNNDTITTSIYSCDSALKGTYTIGTGGYFLNANDAMKAITLCGLSGPVVFKFKSGNYSSLNIPNAIAGASAVNTVTFISEANHADSVIIGSSNRIPLYINNASYLIFKYLTFDGASGASNTIKFENDISNIDIKYCHIKSDPSSTTSSCAAVYYYNSSVSNNRMYNIKFIGNKIDGGYYNMYLYYTGSSTSNIGKITIDSNILSNAYYYSIYSYYYGYYPSISYNTFTSRSSNGGNYWYGIYMYVYNSADSIKGNKFISTNSSIFYPCGMYLGYYLNYNNYGTSGDMIVANNEIILNVPSSQYGMYVYYPYSSKVKILHNSIYLYGTGAANGMYLFNSNSSYKITVQRNNLVTNAGTTAYPIYLGSYYTSSYVLLDYNNYFSTGSYVGYAGGAKTDITTLRAATGQDVNSVSLNPVFKNPVQSLRLTDTSGLTCPRITGVLKDIKGKPRGTRAVIGAYEIDIYEVQVAAIVTPPNASNACSQKYIPVVVSLKNIGDGDLNMSIRPLNIHLRITGGITYQKDTIITIGTLNEAQTMSFTLTNALFLNGIGLCNVKVYVSSIDAKNTNDTLTSYFNIFPTHSYDTLTICDDVLPITYGDSIIYVAGNHSIPLTSINGCDSTVYLTLYVNPTYTHTDTITICDNQLPYRYGDSLFRNAGSFQVHFNTLKGCDSLVVVKLYVNPTYIKTDTVTICDSELPLTYGDSILTHAGSYNIHFNSIDNCDSLIVLSLYVNPTYNHKDTISVCDSQLPFYYGDSLLYAAGSYNVHFSTIKGCDSLVVLRLYVHPTYNQTDTLTICQNQLPYNYGGNLLAAAGNYNIHFTTVKGCDSLVRLRLYVNPVYTRKDTVTICSDKLPFTYGDSLFTTAGSYNVHFSTTLGCDSLIILKLYVNPSYKHYDTVTICSNQLPYSYADSVFTADGSYNVYFTTNKGCDSLVVLRLYVHPTYNHTDTLSICQNQLPYNYGGNLLTAAGNYNIHFTTVKGCDSLVRLLLYVNPVYTRRDTVTICSDQLPFTYGDSLFTTAGSFNVHFSTTLGCDSLIILKLYVNPSYKHYDTVTICSDQLPYSYADSLFTADGSYNVYFTTNKGCDSLVVLRLYVHPTYNHTDTLNICQNQLPYNYGGNLLTAAGNYNIHFTTVKGCDSLVRLRLYVNPVYTRRDTVSLCSDQLPFTYGDSLFTTAGSYNVHFSTTLGCDSLIILKLNVNPSYKHHDTVTICSDQLPYSYADSLFTADGSYNVYFTTNKGCDSLVVLRLYVNPAYNHTDTLAICQNQLPYNYGGNVLTIAGNYNIHFTTIKGCDSLVALCLMVHPTYSKNDTVTICSSQLPFNYGDSILTTAGNYLIPFTTIYACDSLIMLTLNVNPSFSSRDTLTICEDELPYTYGDSILTIGGTHHIIFTALNGCDSMVTLQLYVNPTYTIHDTVTICDTNYARQGNYMVLLQSINGCDSMVVLTVRVNLSFTVKDTIHVCVNELPYSYHGQQLTSSGNYNIHLSTIKGCDSLVLLTLIDHPTYLDVDTLRLSSTQFPFTYGDSTFYVEGDYTVNFKSIYGCDSIINLRLIEKISAYNHQDSVTLCSNEFPFAYGDSVFTTGGVHKIVFKSIDGLDSTITLTIYVNQAYYLTDLITLCDNEFPYAYGDSIYNQGGVYSLIYKTFEGCDSIITLTIIENPTYMGNETITICNTDLPFNYGDSVFTKAGDYPVNFHTYSGCDSTINLRLNVNAVPSAPLKIKGDTVITQTGNYTYFVDTVQGSQSYEWSISNPSWTGTSTSETISINIPTAGTATISVKAVNNCGKSSETTLVVKSSVGLSEKDVINCSLGQNIPNPAKETTLIPYAIPQGGKVVFNVMSINGQVLYTKHLQATAGNHLMEIDLNALSAGIYYYSMEYQGKRIVKKMTIEK